VFGVVVKKMEDEEDRSEIDKCQPKNESPIDKCQPKNLCGFCRFCCFFLFRTTTEKKEDRRMKNLYRLGHDQHRFLFGGKKLIDHNALLKQCIA